MNRPDGAIKRLHERVAESVRVKALADFRAGHPARRPRPLLLAQAVSVAVLTLPSLIGLAGLMIMVVGYPYVGRVILGGLLVWVGWMIRPWKATLPKHLLTSTDAP